MDTSRQKRNVAKYRPTGKKIDSFAVRCSFWRLDGDMSTSDDLLMIHANASPFGFASSGISASSTNVEGGLLLVTGMPLSVV
jgi:hypothetical protein